ncbi:translation initiation factor IF-2-like [Dioscorea cayenensis subsp. rotundata]|uniref:Translation initiation factor IF-2-like n=1 Tax=Dioscorea cayennensis subsp. rotundata TaxID=55577 RepID=A0AB40AVE3_DIOCR|nr:translation initiation factor IF-2-like [Dioscorea cayenensis subsp. rotundata]
MGEARAHGPSGDRARRRATPACAPPARRWAGGADPTTPAGGRWAATTTSHRGRPATGQPDPASSATGTPGDSASVPASAAQSPPPRSVGPARARQRNGPENFVIGEGSFSPWAQPSAARVTPGAVPRHAGHHPPRRWAGGLLFAAGGRVEPPLPAQHPPAVATGPPDSASSGRTRGLQRRPPPEPACPNGLEKLARAQWPRNFASGV